MTYHPRPEEIPSGLCECGCGQPTTIATITHRRKRKFAGHPVPRLTGHTRGLVPSGAAHHSWKGGRVHNSSGYILLLQPDHPKADKDGYVLEHRLLAEARLGRPLLRTEHVHHVNGVKDDNRDENLVVLTKAEHSRLHHGDLYTHTTPKMREAARQRFLAQTPEERSATGRKGAAARWHPEGIG